MLLILSLDEYRQFDLIEMGALHLHRVSVRPEPTNWMRGFLCVAAFPIYERAAAHRSGGCFFNHWSAYTPPNTGLLSPTTEARE